ncbi:hypothetical protein PoB_003811800 [Plakobranchus ocellatus]|uniref:Uncharacterized protein n=1 Tax=Plakobranchus ocellatus TaxID=259542 RepID=A0AAV4AXM4_9GAST|nr:hypothetical protein PoB_003811800 [Plakobranchus ocellatus]
MPNLVPQKNSRKQTRTNSNGKKNVETKENSKIPLQRNQGKNKTESRGEIRRKTKMEVGKPYNKKSDNRWTTRTTYWQHGRERDPGGRQQQNLRTVTQRGTERHKTEGNGGLIRRAIFCANLDAGNGINERSVAVQSHIINVHSPVLGTKRTFYGVDPRNQALLKFW